MNYESDLDLMAYGYGYIVFDSEEEMYQAYNETQGDGTGVEIPVYASLWGANGHFIKENT